MCLARKERPRAYSITQKIEATRLKATESLETLGLTYIHDIKLRHDFQKKFIKWTKQNECTGQTKQPY